MTRSRAKAARYGTGEIGFDEERGLWYGRVELPRKPDGSRDRRRVTARDKDEMLEKLDRLKDRVRSGVTVPSKRWTVRTWGDHYLEHGLAPEKSASTYADALNHWIYPHVGTVPLAKLQPEHVDRMLLALKRAGRSNGSRAKARTVLSAIVTAAQRRGMVRENVVRLTSAPATTKQIGDALTPEQVASVLAYVAGDPADDRPVDRLEALAVLALFVGMRQAECLDLRWDALDLKARTLRIGEAKTEAGERWIPLPDRVVDALTAHRKRQTAERLAAPVWGDAELVFASTIGTRIDRRNCLRWWHGITEASGVGRRRFHASRHTAGTVMLNAGVSLEVVSAILGHGGLAITAKFYAHAGAELLRTGADAMDRAIPASSSSASSRSAAHGSSSSRS